MIEVKVFELRDRMTFIPLCAVRVDLAKETHPGDSFRVRSLLRRAGWSVEGPGTYVFHLGEPHKGIQYDFSDWRDRTFQAAHQWLTEHWDETVDGQVIDVRVILGEAKLPAESELR